MADRLVKFLSHADMVTVCCVDTTELVEKARKIHKMNPTPTAALGRTLTMGTMMGAALKGENEKVTIQILGNGAIGSILVVANAKAEVKGYVSNAMAEADSLLNGKLNVGGIVGKGNLNVIKDIGLKEPYVGNVPLQTGEIAEDFAYYYAVSEQVPSAVALGVLVNRDGSVKKAGGYLVQILPDTPEEIIALIEKRLSTVKSITQMLEEGMTLEEIAKYVTDDLNTRKTEELIPSWKCDCSKERMEKALLTLGKQELEELQKDEITQLECHFCNQKYKFTSEEIKKLLEQASTESAE